MSTFQFLGELLNLKLVNVNSLKDNIKAIDQAKIGFIKTWNNEEHHLIRVTVGSQKENVKEVILVLGSLASRGESQVFQHKNLVEIGQSLWYSSLRWVAPSEWGSWNNALIVMQAFFQVSKMFTPGIGLQHFPAVNT